MMIVEFERITIDPDVMGGAPCIRGSRVPVATVVAMMAEGMTADEIIADLPDLTLDDIVEALRYSAEAVRQLLVAATARCVKSCTGAGLMMAASAAAGIGPGEAAVGIVDVAHQPRGAAGEDDPQLMK